MLEFEWDDEKAERNLRKHAFSFEDAVRAFEDDYFFELGLEVSPDGEIRKQAVAMSGVRIVAIVHAERNRRIRIISARKANRRERKIYAENRPE